MENIVRPTFDQTVAVLVKAFLDGKLTHQDCAACVVGNLCNGSKIWRYLFCTDASTGEQYQTKISEGDLVWNNFETADELIQAARFECFKTGYSIAELAKIENAFETAPGFVVVFDECNCLLAMNVEENEEWMFNGLMAVVDVLADIHGIDLTAKEEAKQLFTKL